MAGVQELMPALGSGAACRALGLWRGAPARRAARPSPPLALDTQERQELLATLNGERFADTAPAAVHADRGASMRSKPVAELLVDPDIAKSHSRPHVSHDNPYSESQFKTMKYRPDFPARFGCIEDARALCQSGIGYMTPHAVHHCRADALPTAAWINPPPQEKHPERRLQPCTVNS